LVGELFQVPVEEVSDEPTIAEPVITGTVWTTGADACAAITVIELDDVIDETPALFVALISQVIRPPTSPVTVVYVLVVAPDIAVLFFFH
jgi:hypothetical protein